MDEEQAAGIIGVVKAFVTAYKVHPILVNFTAALVPVSIFSDILGRLTRRESLKPVAWWTLLFAAVITPFTAIAGWLFWMDDDAGVRGMIIHKWLGTGFAVVLIFLMLWRGHFHRKARWPNIVYLLVMLMALAALIYQGRLGGDQSFGNADMQKSPAPTQGQ